jgi:hypothetical protein
MKFNATSSSFQQRVNSVYDPTKLKAGPNMWKVDKNSMINFMKVNRSKLENNLPLMRQINTVKKSTDFKFDFPLCKYLKPQPNKYIYNDYHTKNTAPGYDRNCYGKPFFA